MGSLQPVDSSELQNRVWEGYWRYSTEKSKHDHLRWKLIVKSPTELQTQWIGLREKLQENPIFNGKIYGFRLKFSQQNQSIHKPKVFVTR